MIKFKIIHGDVYSDLHQEAPIWFLRLRWKKWRKKYLKIMNTPKKKSNTIVKQAQAWHILCALTAVLKIRGDFNFNQEEE